MRYSVLIAGIALIVCSLISPALAEDMHSYHHGVHHDVEHKEKTLSPSGRLQDRVRVIDVEDE